MGCQTSSSEVNQKFFDAIDRLDFTTIHYLIHKTDHKLFDPTILHYAVCSNQIDLVAILIDQSNYY